MKEGKKSGRRGSSRAGGRRYARGNSRNTRLSLLPCPVRLAGTRPTLAHVADTDGSAGTEATSNHDATWGSDAAASGRG